MFGFREIHTDKLDAQRDSRLNGFDPDKRIQPKKATTDEEAETFWAEEFRRAAFDPDKRIGE